MIQIDVDIPTNVRVAAALKGGAEHIFFSEIKDVTVREDRDEFPESIFLFKGNRVIMEIKGFKQVWCSYTLLWSKIESYFGGRYSDTQRFIKSMVEEHFKLRDVAPNGPFTLRCTQVEEHFKLRDVTPGVPPFAYLVERVEEHFKLRDVTPFTDFRHPSPVVERHFKPKD